MIKICFIIFITILILYYYKNLIFKGGFNFKCSTDKSSKDYVYSTLLPNFRRIHAKTLKSVNQKFINIINEKLYNLTFNDYSINNLKNNDYIIHFLFTTSGQSSLNNSISLFEELKTYINTKYNELVGIYGGKINNHYKGGLLKNMLSKKQYKKICIKFSKIDLNSLENLIEKKNIFIKKNFKTELIDIKINYDKQIDNIITKINSNESILQKLDYIKQTLNNLYKPIISKDYFNNFYGKINSNLTQKFDFPTNYSYIFHMDYIKNLEEHSTGLYYNIKNITNRKVPDDYNFSNLDNSYNFYITSVNDSYNSALYLNSNKSYILYYPNENNPKARTMFDNVNITHKNIIKINNLIFTLDSVIFNDNGPIKFNIDINSIKYDLFNHDIIKTLYYHKHIIN